MAPHRLTLAALADGGTTAVLQTVDHCEVLVPRFLLPQGASVGSVVVLDLALDAEASDSALNTVRQTGGNQENCQATYKKRGRDMGEKVE